MRKFLLGCLALGLAACSPSAGDAAPQSGQTAHTSKAEQSLHPESGLPVIPLTVEHNGKRLHFRVEVAATGPEQAKGLMFRTSLGADEGMIFPMDPPRSASFWMKNTLIPLDIIYIGVDGRISNIAANAVPRDLTPLRSVGLVKGVLELRGGRAAELGIVPGDKVKW